MNVKDLKVLFEPIVMVTAVETGWNGEFPTLEHWRAFFWRIRLGGYWKMVTVSGADIEGTFQNIVRVTREVIEHERRGYLRGEDDGESEAASGN